ncbi:MAG: hypothetical protein HQK81_14250 [Desulfovibrionaceae bacterium]|nr:hypothetical protein [Desulfovibrionaceae bacterium]MBF0515205.1 hypothetical protein [Desulfovibrionaceae bacterium]
MVAAKKVQIHQHPEELLAKIREGFEELRSRKVMTNRVLVETLAGEIRKLMAEGHSVNAILEVITANEVDLKPSTLRFYLGQVKDGASPTRAKTPSKGKPEATPAAAPRSGKKNKDKKADPAPAAAPTNKGGFVVTPDPEEI